MTITKEDFERVTSDTNGNPRYAIHFTLCRPNSLQSNGLDNRYAETCKLMNKIGGRKYHNKSYGGGIVFQSYNLDETIKGIKEIKAEYDAAFNNLDPNRKYGKYERILMDAIENDGFEDCDYYQELNTDRDRAEFVRGRFMSEYGWRVEQLNGNEQKALIDWLSGLALNIPYMNCDILELVEMHLASEKEQNRILNNYWSFMAMRLLGVWRYFELQSAQRKVGA